MCGIVGFVGTSDCKKIIFNGLSKLQNRGYDSAGISIIDNNSIKTFKYASDDDRNALDVLEYDITSSNINSSIGIGHTRWATHGSKTSINAHPHNDYKERLSIVHNGIIENWTDLKANLIAKGYKLISHTDTEVIIATISMFLDENYNIDEAIHNTLAMLKGTWALCIIYREQPNCMWITRNGSPLLIGFDDNYMIVASESSAFNNLINQYIAIDNNDIIKINNTKNISHNCDMQRYKLKKVESSNSDILPESYKHWMLKEIHEQPRSIDLAINNGGRISGNTTVKLGGLDVYKSTLENIDHLILLGCGTSYHAGLWSLNEFKQYDIFNTVSCYDGAEFDMLDIPKKGNTAILLLSQSGETKDLHRCIEIAKNYDLITIGVVNVPDSLISRETDCGVYLNAGREYSVASTKSFTNQCIILSLIAIWFSQVKGTCLNKRHHTLCNLTKLKQQVLYIFENNEHKIKKIIENININDSIFVLGKGSSEAIAKEGALKIKEVTYIHAEGYSASALKHGPFALIQNNTCIIIVDINKKHHNKCLNAYNETSSRYAHNIIITDNANPYIEVGMDENNIITIDHNETYGNLIANICLQLISYYLSVKLNINPDFPRNLAKVVTVE